ncbi:Ig-like domain-containing protein, partial [Pseudomonas edaphica]
MTITGKAEPGSTVEVKFPDGTTGTVVAKPDGSFTLTSSNSQPNGDYAVTVSDAAGNKGVSVTGNFTADPAVDITPPTAPAGLVVTTLPDGKVKVSGNAEANSKITVTLPDGTTQDVTAGPSGVFELTSNAAQPNGTIKIIATDAAGNSSAPVTTDFVADSTIDTTPPATPSGLVAVTLPDGKLKLSGSAEANSKVTVTLPDGTTLQVTAGGNGAFELTSNGVQPNGLVSVTATDAAGHISPAATATYQTTDVTPPVAPADLIVVTLPDGKLKLSGSAEANSKVTVTLPDGTTQQVTVGANGVFELTSTGVQPNGAIQVIATDAAGNASAKTTINFIADNTVDVTPPAPPTGLLAVTLPGGKVKVSGSVEANSQVTVVLPDGTPQQVTAGPNGFFELTSNGVQPNGLVSVTATDAAGHVSPATTVTYQTTDATPPTAPADLIVVTLPDGKLKLTGSAEANNKVTVTLPDGTTQQVTTGANGTFELTSTGVQPNGAIQVIATDAAGNASAKTTINFIADNTVDVTPPAAPSDLVVVTLPDGKLKLSGSAEANSKVTVTLPDNTTRQVTTDSNGHFELTSNTVQPNGTVKVIAADAAGNASTQATIAFVADNTVDVTPPAPPTGLLAVTLPDGKLKLTGSAEAHSKVTVILPDGTTQQVTVGANGAFELTSNGVQPNGTVQVAATDVAGNTGTAASVDFVANNTVDTTPPAAPTGLVAVTLPDGKVKVSGTAEANSKVTVTLP